jgi:hypothetical protein
VQRRGIALAATFAIRLAGPELIASTIGPWARASRAMTGIVIVVAGRLFWPRAAAQAATVLRVITPVAALRQSSIGRPYSLTGRAPSRCTGVVSESTTTPPATTAKAAIATTSCAGFPVSRSLNSQTLKMTLMIGSTTTTSG